MKSFGASTHSHIHRKPCVQGTGYREASSGQAGPGWINKRNCWWVQWTCSKEPGHSRGSQHRRGESVLSTRSELSRPEHAASPPALPSFREPSWNRWMTRSLLKKLSVCVCVCACFVVIVISSHSNDYSHHNINHNLYDVDSESISLIFPAFKFGTLIYERLLRIIWI